MELVVIPGLSLLLLAIPIVVVALVVGAVGRAATEDGPADDPGIGTVRRLFLYGLAFISLGLAGTGIGLLLGGILDALIGDRLVSASTTELATALSLTVVGLPAWGIFILITQRSVRQNAVEHRSLARGFYLLLVRAITLSVVVVNAITALGMVTGLEEFRGSPWGWLIVGLIVWGLHQRLTTGEGIRTAAARILDRGYLAFGSVLGLYVLAAGLVTAIIEPGTAAYDAAFRSELIRTSGWSDEVTRALILIAVGAVTWWWHWIARLRTSETTLVWHIVIFLFGILAGVAAAIAAGGAALYTVLAWALGVSTALDTAQHFAGIVPMAAFVVVGGGSWLYHRAVLRERISPDEVPSDPARIYRYLLATAGLVAAGSGIVAALALAIDGLVPIGDLVRPGDWWRDQLAVTLTLIIVGAPLWWLSWSAAQSAVDRGDIAERASTPRRAFLFIVFAVAVLVSLGNLAALLFQLFNAALEGDFTRETVRDLRWPVAMLLTAGAIAGYYWLVLKDDQAQTAQTATTEAHEVEPIRDAEPATGTQLAAAPVAASVAPPAASAPPAERTVVLVAPAGTLDVAAEHLEQAGFAVSRVQRLDLAEGTQPPAFESELAGLTSLLRNFQAGEALVVISSTGMDVTPITTTTTTTRAVTGD